VLWCAVLQTSEVSRLESQLQSAAGQRQQLEQQMATLTQQMSSVVAGLGQFMQQQVREPLIAMIDIDGWFIQECSRTRSMSLRAWNSCRGV